jgi:hypothetical protein
LNLCRSSAAPVHAQPDFSSTDLDMYPIFRGYSGNLAILMEGVMAKETATKMQVFVIEDEPTLALLIWSRKPSNASGPCHFGGDGDCLLGPCRSADALSP